MNTEGNPPSKNIPVLWGDYNAVGLSGEANDDCIYSLHRDELSRLGAEEGKVFFVYDDDLDDNDQPEVFGYVCKLEIIEGYISSWRARPDKSTWYRGPKTW
ncbi:MAG: hypothetical protein ACPGR2_14055 [Psychrobium sp.]